MLQWDLQIVVGSEPQNGNFERIQPFKNFSVRCKALMGRAWLCERLRRWSSKPDVVGSISVTTEFFFISCDSNQVPKWFGTHYDLEVPL